MRNLPINLSALPLAAVLAGALCVTCAKPKQAQSTETIRLTMGSWRADDVAHVTKLLAEYKKIQPAVDIQFRPTNPPDYNATLRLQLESGTAPDLMYARSYAPGRELYSAGYFGDCSDIPGVKTNFSPASLAPWQMDDGTVFAVPFAAVSHGVYYNKTLFEQAGLAVPQTWEGFLQTCAALQASGVYPLANGAADEWDILEVFFLGMLPNFAGGAEERAQYETGAKSFNSPDITAAFQAMADVSPYLPKGYEAVTYNDSQALFNTQQAAMFMDGSWTAGVYADAPFAWGVFAMPAPEGRKTMITFHPDMAITYNKATKHPQECRDFLAWLAAEDGAAIASENLPLGFFPMINFPIELKDPHANEFLALNNGRDTDVRFVWPSLLGLYAPLNQAVIRVVKGEKTPSQAAAELEAEAAPLRGQ